MPSGSSLEAPLGEAFPCIDTKEGIKKGNYLNRRAKQVHSNSDEQVRSLDPNKCKMCWVFGKHCELLIYSFGKDTGG